MNIEPNPNAIDIGFGNFEDFTHIAKFQLTEGMGYEHSGKYHDYLVGIGQKTQLTEQAKREFQERYRSKIKDTRPPRKRKKKHD